MRKLLLFLVSVVILGLASSGLMANPGTPADKCIIMKPGKEKAFFTNNCGERAFVFYCGSLKYSKKKCGEDGNYYTHSFNIKAGETRDIDIAGRITWGACLGGVSFGRDEFSDSPDGSFKCKKTPSKK